jgi:high-affinity iron transporter
MVSKDAAELEEQRALVAELVASLEQLGPDGAQYVDEAKALQQQVNAQAPGEDVAKRCGELGDRIRTTQKLVLWPTRAPDLGDAQTLYTSNCVSCHGVNGDAKTPIGEVLKPPPASFHDPGRMAGMTPYRAYNAVTYGIERTGMAPFKLSDDQRWALAFFVFTHRQPECTHPPVKVSLEELATSTDGQLSEKYGAAELPCLRRVMPGEDVAAALAETRTKIHAAGQLAHDGDVTGARRGLTDAYLTGVEPVEPMLKLHDAALISRIETGFSRARETAGTPAFDGELKSLDALLLQAAQPRSAADFWSVLVAALLILLREGFEAMVVVGALLAVLKKMARDGHAEAAKGLNAVHLGWVTALLLGALGFVLGHQALAAANREWMETVVSFIAVGLLIYAALWLNARSNMSRFMGQLRGKMQSAFSSGSLFGLFIISFTAVGRESFETAIFLQGLSADSLSGTVWGAALGGVAMLVFVVVVRRVGFVLPMKTLFNASTVLLVATALMLVGKGMHGLQELGVLNQKPLPFFSVEALGVFADIWTLVPQLLLLGAALALWRMQPPTGRAAPPAR